MPEPIKRHPSLQPLSRDHHDALMLCWKIRQGLKKSVTPKRIKEYCWWFWESHLNMHFQLEEQYLFPLLPVSHPHISQALKEHAALKELFVNAPATIEVLELIEEMLEAHIRFEERTLFNELQAVATPAQLEQAENAHSKSPFCERSGNAFWL